MLGRSQASLSAINSQICFLAIPVFLGPTWNSNPRLQDGDAEVLQSKEEEEILGAMGLEEQETVVITVDDQVIGKGNAPYHQRASQMDLSVLPFCAVTTEYRMFSPSSEEKPFN